MASRILGSGIKRREDPRLITGQARYTDDFALPGMVYMSVVRSPYAHARIRRIDTKEAAAMPGVVGVYTGQQMKDAGFGPIPCAWVVPGSDTKTPPYPPIAIDIVRYVGNAVAIVVAADRYQARDAADVVEEKVGSFVRSVYSKSSSSVHTEPTKREVQSILRFVETCFAELLEL